MQKAFKFWCCTSFGEQKSNPLNAMGDLQENKKNKTVTVM